MQDLVFKREIVHQLKSRLSEPRRFIQVITGPRQVGKTTAVNQILEEWQGLFHYATADLPAPPQPAWIEQQWETARLRAKDNQPVVLVLDEIQKVSRWSEIVKRFKDILLLNRVEKPALLRQLFMLAAENSGQIVSYQKFVGQLMDAGNTTTLAHYQRLLEGACLIWGLPKWHGQALRRRASTPKWIALNTALITAIAGVEFADWRKDASRWGRLVETAVGAHLINTALGTGIEVYYWRDNSKEVDYVLKQANKLLAIEVKSGLFKGKHSGLSAFVQKFPKAKTLLVGQDGISIEEFLSHESSYWLKKCF